MTRDVKLAQASQLNRDESRKEEQEIQLDWGDHGCDADTARGGSCGLMNVEIK